MHEYASADVDKDPTLKPSEDCEVGKQIKKAGADDVQEGTGDAHETEDANEIEDEHEVEVDEDEL